MLYWWYFYLWWVLVRAWADYCHFCPHRVHTPFEDANERGFDHYQILRAARVARWCAVVRGSICFAGSLPSRKPPQGGMMLEERGTAVWRAHQRPLCTGRWRHSPAGPHPAPFADLVRDTRPPALCTGNAPLVTPCIPEYSPGGTIVGMKPPANPVLDRVGRWWATRYATELRRTALLTAWDHARR